MASTLRALALLHVRQSLRAGVKSGPPKVSVRSLARSTLAAALLLLLGLMAYLFATGWVSSNRALAEPVVAHLLSPDFTRFGSGAFIITFFYAFTALTATFTDGRDLRLLLLAPIRSEVVIGERVLATSLGFSAIMLLVTPALFAIGTGVGLSYAYYPAVLFAILFLPILPVSLATLLLVVVMRHVPPARARTISMVVGTGASAAFFLGARLLLAPTGFSAPSVPSWLPSAWPGRFVGAVALNQPAVALAYGTLMSVCAIILFAIAIRIAARTFATGSGSYREVSREPILHASEYGSESAVFDDLLWMPSAASEHGGATLAKRPAWLAVFVKDWVCLRRDPQRLVLFMYPLLIIGFNAFEVLSGDGRANHLVSMGTTLGLLLLAAVMLVNTTTPSLIGAEGRALILLSLAPMSSRSIVITKWITAALPPLIVVEAAVGILSLYLGTKAANIALIALTLALVTIALCGACLSATIAWPKLDATNPRRQASGLARAVSMITGLVICVGAGILLFLSVFVWKGALSAEVVLGLLAALALLITVLLVLATRLLRGLMHSEKLLRGPTL